MFLVPKQLLKVEVGVVALTGKALPYCLGLVE